VVILLQQFLGLRGRRVGQEKGKQMEMRSPLRLQPTGESIFRPKNFANVESWTKLGESILAIGDVFTIGCCRRVTRIYVFLGKT
jgi:hypothetical protein